MSREDQRLHALVKAFTEGEACATAPRWVRVVAERLVVLTGLGAEPGLGDIRKLALYLEFAPGPGSRDDRLLACLKEYAEVLRVRSLMPAGLRKSRPTDPGPRRAGGKSPGG